MNKLTTVIDHYKNRYRASQLDLQAERATTASLEQQLDAMGKDLYIANARLDEVDDDRAEILRLTNGIAALTNQVHGIETDFFTLVNKVERIKAILREV